MRATSLTFLPLTGLLFGLLCLVVAEASAQQLTLSWQDNSSNESGFAIEKKLTGTVLFFEIVRVPTNRETWTDTSVEQNVSYTYRVRAYNAFGVSGYSNEASGIPRLGSLVLAQINFQPTASSVPGGYRKDDGSIYTAARGYGWLRDLRKTARDRQLLTDQRLDTFVATGHNGRGKIATWNYALPNGAYLVTLASGDAALRQGPHRVVVEGQVVIDNIITPARQFVVRTDIPVTVADGKLTVRIGGARGNTMVNYLIIERR